MKGLPGLAVVLVGLSALAAEGSAPEPMLKGEWFEHPHAIDFAKLPRVKSDHVVVSDVSAAGGVNQHNYLVHHDGRFWLMWSDGPGVEDRVGQQVKYATSSDGLRWSQPGDVTGFPPASGPGSPRYNTRSKSAFRYIARGFWVRDGELLALVSRDEASAFFGPGLQLLAWRWNRESQAWQELGVVFKDAINNFAPVKLSSGEWMMSRRSHDYRTAGVGFLIGGGEAWNRWEAVSVPEGLLSAEEPVWWELPDGRVSALFRDNGNSGYLFRSVSSDSGRTWSRPVQTDFPDARSKFHGLRLKDGRYVLVSNANPKGRDPLTLAISEDGLVFDRLYHLVGGAHNGVDYPMIMEQEGYVFIAHSGGRGPRKQSVEIQRVRLTDLDQLHMTDARMQPFPPNTPSSPSDPQN